MGWRSARRGKISLVQSKLVQSYHQQREAGRSDKLQVIGINQAQLSVHDGVPGYARGRSQSIPS
ncbi:hypothetical protein DPMN_176364 [Dreissena polymorpha]|uniref:Uncharacterized protein n=1 Tax=Dreissena polymorpha TaxID=45954 RepID=A0A9D4E6S3_DREPO|nr:hypothetical protein DPMN_176364 [Dreissena polymorpha]